MLKDIWFAIIQVEPINNNNDLDGAKGAYVNVAYRAPSRNDFFKTVRDTFNGRDFNVLEIDEVERGDKLSIDNPDNAEKLLLLKDVESEYDYSWGNFHTYQ